MALAWLVVFLAIFLIGVTKSGFGSGVGLMIVPMTVMALGHTRHGSRGRAGVDAAAADRGGFDRGLAVPPAV